MIPQSRPAVSTPAHNALDVANLSHPGMVRAHNEDAIFVDGAGLAVLADGMGGYNAGEVASGIAVSVIKEGLMPELMSGRDLSKVDIHTGLTHAALLLQQQIAAANKGIYEAAQNRPECAGMGTTVVAAVFHGARVSIAHIGDSRCYRLRGGRFEQLTRDHSLLQEQIDSGQITADQARFSLNKNLVTRALGIEAIVPADISEYRVEPDDVYLLCSDGLTDMVDTDVVHGVVDEQRATLEVAATQLIELANQNGGRDNISVILARVPAAFLPNNKWAQSYLARKRQAV
jgi:protein phosphatase